MAEEIISQMIHPSRALQKSSCQCPCLTMKWPSPIINRYEYWVDRESLLFLKLSRSGDESTPSVTCSRVPTTLTFRKPSRNRLPLSASNIQPYSFQNCIQLSLAGFLSLCICIQNTGCNGDNNIRPAHTHAHRHTWVRTLIYTHADIHPPMCARVVRYNVREKRKIC